jgi:hypothetical protein
MPIHPDDQPRLSGTRICEITGVNRQTRDKWASDGLVRKSDYYDQLDLVELVVLNLLLHTLRKKHAKIAWIRVRAKLKDLLPGPQLTLVWDAERRTADLAFDRDEIVELVRIGRPVQVIDLGGAIERAREAFRRDAEAASAIAESARAADRSAAPHPSRSAGSPPGNPGSRE